MTEHQFNALAELLSLPEPDKAAAFAVVFEGAQPTAATESIVTRLRQADAKVRGAYVVHGPMEFRVEVGHRDTHRAVGSLRLAVGDLVRLTARASERWVPVRIVALPQRPIDYFMGVIVEQLSANSRYAVGDGVEFSEDQVVLDAARAVGGLRRRRF